jgi:predicted RNA-binding protein associated with RNAse of E/G family
MKRKYADRQNWSRIERKSFEVEYIETKDFTGYITRLMLEEVREPLWVSYQDIQVCIADNQHTWVQYFPSGAYFTITKMLDDRGQVVQWYIDICHQYGVDEKGIPWYDDLYLDIVILPNKEPFLLDLDELKEALKYGEIPKSDYDLALKEAQRLMKEIREGTFPFIKDEHPINDLK